MDSRLRVCDRRSDLAIPDSNAESGFRLAPFLRKFPELALDMADCLPHSSRQQLLCPRVALEGIQAATEAQDFHAKFVDLHSHRIRRDHTIRPPGWDCSALLHCPKRGRIDFLAKSNLVG